MMRIVFMGTPAFAVPALEALADNEYDVVAAVTQPDRPSGRKMLLTPCAVKQAATARGIPVLQFERIRRQEGLDALRALTPDLFVTAAFGQILSRKVLDIPSMGTVNVHASLLPKYRGPAPINWCIIQGETTTGVTTMLTDEGIDTGDILLQQAVPIGPDETAGTLTDTLSHAGAALLMETLRAMEAGTLHRTVQDGTAATRQPMLNKQVGRIDWALPAGDIHNLVRGVNPWPGAFTALPDGGVLKIWQSKPVADDASGAQPGTILRADARTGLTIACGTGALEVLRLQAPGARPLSAMDYLRGHAMDPGLVLGSQEA